MRKLGRKFHGTQISRNSAYTVKGETRVHRMW